MDPEATSPDSAHDTSGGLHFCALCDKPFIKEASYNRHLSYCRRAQSRPRSRARSCRACALAKTKCSFQPRCMRCTTKGLECVYENPIAARKSKRMDEIPTPMESTILSSPVLGGDELTLDELFPFDGISNIDDARLPMDLNGFGFAATDLPLQTSKRTSNMISGPTQKTMPNSSLLSNNSSDEYSFNNSQNATLAENVLSEKVPWSAWTAQDDYAPVLSRPSSLLLQPNSGYLARLPITDPIMQRTATLIMQQLRAFPQMMLRRETLPPFIHAHWNRPSSTTSTALPEPLANCMSIAHLFASRNSETTPFLWRTVKQEQRSFLEKQETRRFSRDDLLAAVQAQIMYIIMRVIDDTTGFSELNVEMLMTFKVLCENFRMLCDQPFCVDEQSYPSSNWEDWIFGESRRRTACLWFLLGKVVSIKTGTSCDTTDYIRALPLPLPKSLWEANTRLGWESEYAAFKCTSKQAVERLGDLIEACKRSGEISSARRLDTWNAGADNLGTLLGMATATM